MTLQSLKYPLLVIAAGLYFVLGLYFALLLISGSLTVYQFLTLHALGILFSLTLFPLYLATSSPFIPLFWLFNATLGCFGAFLILLMLLLYSSYGYILDPLQKLLAAILPHIYRTRGDVVYERLRYGLEFSYKDSSAIPFNDVMHYGSTEQKITAIGKILRFFTPEFSEALRIAATDKQGSVRVMAATAISHLDEKYFKKYQKLGEEVKSAKDKRNPLLHLAHHAEEYSRCLFFDETRRLKMREVAIDAYEEFLLLAPGDQEAKERLASLLSLAGRSDEAAQILLSELERGTPINKTIYVELMNAYLLQKKYEEMRELTARYFDELYLLADKEDYGPFDELFHTWSLSIETERMMRSAHGEG